MMPENNDLKEKLMTLIREAVAGDKKLREEYQMGDKFRFIADRLAALSMRVEENIAALQKKAEKITGETLVEDETLVYVYLYNTHGLSLQSWLKMLNPSVFYEYSVNRPVYAEKKDIEAYIRTKVNKTHHGYLTVIVKKTEILPAGAELQKDTLGNPLIKVREGSLKAEKLISFSHNGHDYRLTESGELVKKENN
jgi:hypothetical protein